MKKNPPESVAKLFIQRYQKYKIIFFVYLTNYHSWTLYLVWLYVFRHTDFFLASASISAFASASASEKYIMKAITQHNNENNSSE